MVSLSGGNTQLFFLFFLDDDSRRDHHHQAGGFASNTGVLEQTVDERDLVEDRNTLFVTAFAQTLDAAEEDGTAVRNADRRGDGDVGVFRQLDRRT